VFKSWLGSAALFGVYSQIKVLNNNEELWSDSDLQMAAVNLTFVLVSAVKFSAEKYCYSEKYELPIFNKLEKAKRSINYVGNGISFLEECLRVGLGSAALFGVYSQIKVLNNNEELWSDSDLQMTVVNLTFVLVSALKFSTEKCCYSEKCKSSFFNKLERATDGLKKPIYEDEDDCDSDEEFITPLNS
jgi:hypothetical protein